jgi:hypothetical protein
MFLWPEQLAAGDKVLGRGINGRGFRAPHGVGAVPAGIEPRVVRPFFHEIGVLAAGDRLAVVAVNIMSNDGDRRRVRELREAAARKYLPERVDLLLVAEAPPAADDRYFYFEHVQSNDWLFLGVAEVLLGEKPIRVAKASVLAGVEESRHVPHRSQT